MPQTGGASNPPSGSLLQQVNSYNAANDPDLPTDRVLAVHMLGTDAPEIVQSLAVALTCGATKAQFDRTLAVHPTAAEEFVLMREPARVVGPASPD